MNIVTTQHNSGRGNFLCLLLLTGFFILLEVSFFLQCNQTYFSDFTFVSDQLHLPLTVVPGIAFFVMAQLLIHLLFCLLIWLIANAISNNFKIAIGLWLIGVIAVIAANQYYFPNSKFAELSAILLNGYSAKFILIVTSSVMTIAAILAILKSRLLKLMLILGMGIAFYYQQPSQFPIANIATKDKPNIIIIGVDSLRPDYLGYFGHQTITPFFDGFLNQATVFSDAVTPLARTFPSWTSILTGEYPKTIGMRSNLSEQSHSDLSKTLPMLLRHAGYDTLYATDETRFSNIDKNYGFDQVITPPMGLNDFLLGTFNDFPLSNLLVNTVVGKWLFPHSYANRPVFFIYQPDTFLQLIKPSLLTPKTKPLFLAVHFCLPHHPYLWASLSGYDYKPLQRYEMSVQRVDQQLNDFFSLLKQAHLLDHAIVVLLSDHGEALELPGDRITESDLFVGRKHEPIPHFYPPSLAQESINQSVGHGTDVLSLTQYHTLLAFKLYGIGEQHVGVMPGAISLLAVKPTLLSLVSNKMLPRSLATTIRHGAYHPQAEHIFIESDFTPQAIRTVYPEAHLVLLEGIQIFKINPSTTRLTVKDDMNMKIIRSKQVADLYDHWMLALYPQNNHYRMPILINLETGQWTNDLRSSFAHKSPAVEMLTALHTFYDTDIK